MDDTLKIAIHDATEAFPMNTSTSETMAATILVRGALTMLLLYLRVRGEKI